ncbi:MAG: hypothetical protein CR986_04890 [Ignavibacteriae bacterium]|nr:MAG: hypothetical protein CR986_04890 [Ignavibacteriota bacterium]
MFKLKNYLLIFTILLFSYSLVYSQVQNNEAKKTSNNLLYKSGAAVLTTSLLFLLDDEIRTRLQKKSLENNTLQTIGKNYGEFYYNLAFTGTLYLSNFIFKDERIAKTSKALLESLLVGGLINGSLKFILGRARPYKNKGNYSFHWFETDNAYNSLTSGHTVTAFATSTILAKIFDNTYASILLYGLAGITAYQRMISDNHWFTDVFLGAAVGYFTAEYFYNKNKNNYSIIPFIYKDVRGISLSYKF